MKNVMATILGFAALGMMAAFPAHGADAQKMFQTYQTGATRDFSGYKNLVPDFADQPVGFGIQLKVERENRSNARWQEVDHQQHVFRNNDRVRFKMKTNGSCYLMLLNNGNLIWPVKRGRNLIPDTEFQHPGDREITIGPFKVVPPATKEENVLVLSPRPFSQQAEILDSTTSSVPPPPPTTVQNVEMEDIASIESQLRTSSRTGRNLVYETDDATTYVVSDDADPVKPMRYEFTLYHQ